MMKARILIVEDSFIVAHHLQSTLEAEGYIVLDKCDSAERALEVVEKNKPDLVLMDIMLTGPMDGIEAALHIKHKHSIPVIYITALTDRDTIQRAKITEPYGYLTKPFEDREIFTVIEMALYKHEIESKLRASEEKYLSTIKAISDCVLVVDCDYKVTYINPSAERLIDMKSSEAAGKEIYEVLKLHDEFSQEVLNPVQCYIHAGEHSSMPSPAILTAKNGKEIPVGESGISLLIDSKERISGLVLVFKDLTEKRALEKLTEDFERQKVTALIEGQEQERSRIARDLHDGLGQILNAIKINANIVISNKTDAASVNRLLDEAIQESVRISENLLPSKLNDFDLPTCLKSLCNQVSRSTQMNVLFSSQDVVTPVSKSVKVNFYRIAQEAVNNAIKHSEAKDISVQLVEDANLLRLTIEDNGRGFTSTKTTDLYKHNGLINMRDRARIMKGKLSIESDINRGTLIIIEVPLEKQTTYAEI